METSAAADPHDLGRFLAAQEGVVEVALAELRRGRKESHWMWFIFPQVAGLGGSPMSAFYAIQSPAEAEAYLRHPVLGRRLAECAGALAELEGRTALEVMGHPDDLKLRSSMTLFARVAGGESVFRRVLERYFDGAPDPRTTELLDAAAAS
jgi:uncharacterized protein (DUF1810 family)